MVSILGNKLPPHLSLVFPSQAPWNSLTFMICNSLTSSFFNPLSFGFCFMPLWKLFSSPITSWFDLYQLLPNLTFLEQVLILLKFIWKLLKYFIRNAHFFSERGYLLRQVKSSVPDQLWKHFSFTVGSWFLKAKWTSGKKGHDQMGQHPEGRVDDGWNGQWGAMSD